ncbi:MAG: P-II family nitrogen regulator [Proteobacteria bacterium]|nr:P-II family nitrogen regulator [Pseudomonadota bacterium]
MKMIVAVIHTHQLEAMRRALSEHGIHHYMAAEIRGTAPTSEQKTYHGADHLPQLLKRVRLDIAVNEELVEPCLAAIKKGSDNSGVHGKVFVLDLLDVMTTWDGQRGPEAL